MRSIGSSSLLCACGMLVRLIQLHLQLVTFGFQLLILGLECLDIDTRRCAERHLNEAANPEEEAVCGSARQTSDTEGQVNNEGEE